jgi:o-succinylbenzoate---CoA ligase
VIELAAANTGGVEQDDPTSERTGLITVRAKSLFRGYFAKPSLHGAWQTEDVGMFGPTGGLQVLGRRDAVIITGGKKVWPDEVEALLRATGAFQEVVVLGMPDPEWGERVTACYAGEPMAPERIASIEAQLGRSLARYKLPKRFEAVWPWPMNAQGKVNRARLRELIRTM